MVIDPASISKPSASLPKSSASAECVELGAHVGLLLRTALISELGAQTGFSLRWKPSATPAGRSWLVATISEQTTRENGRGSSAATSPNLPTPVTQSNTGGMRWEGGAGGRKVLKESGLWEAVYGHPTKPRMNGRPSIRPAATILSTPRASDMQAGGHGDIGRMGTVRHQLQKAQESLPTPTKRDKRMDRWSPAYDKRKSPTMDAVLDGAQTGRASDKWAYAREIAGLLSSTGLTGPSMTLPVTYGWMMGYPPGWLSNALRSAVLAGHLPLVSLSRRSATPSSRKSRKPSAGPS